MESRFEAAPLSKRLGTQREELGEVQIEAEFTLESRALCPHCQMAIDSVRVIRLLRSRVNFTSSLPRRGHLMVCPSCHSILNGALGGLF